MVIGDLGWYIMVFRLISVVLSISYMVAALSKPSSIPPDHRYIAAARGEAPPCKLQPGITFCEEVENYPLDQILYALSNTKFDVAKFLVDETLDEGPFFPTDEPSKQSKPLTLTDLGLDIKLHSPQTTPTVSLERTMRPPPPPHPFNKHKSESKFRENAKFWNIPLAQRPTRLNRVARMEPLEIYPNISASLLRSVVQRRLKRQLQEPQKPLCASRLKFIYPKVAMSARGGEWLYLVNIPHIQMTQMIRAEICEEGVEGKPCMEGKCDTPFGFTSKCEQHFLQKRLVTLVPNGGSKVYSDMFWIPTCCVCKTYSSFPKENRS